MITAFKSANVDKSFWNTAEANETDILFFGVDESCTNLLIHDQVMNLGYRRARRHPNPFIPVGNSSRAYKWNDAYLF